MSDSNSSSGKQPPLASMGGEAGALCETHLNIAMEKNSRIDQMISRGSEWLSAILVKEARQALKSRQFVWTFFLLLVIVAAWAVMSISIAFSEGGTPGELGPLMLCGFFDILGFPLAIIIPYSVFRSLAHEYESGTLQMVAITTMKPYQIVAGKLGSAMLQMMMYLAVLAPCISFTYLLRGIDVFQILLGLTVCVFGCVCLCCISLFLACGTRRRSIGIGMTVLLIPALAFVFALFTILSYGISFELTSTSDLFRPEVMVIIWGFFAFAGTTAALAFVSATSLVAFDTENRATRIRLAIIVQQVFFIGWAVSMLGFRDFIDESGWWAFAFTYGHYWIIVGSMLVSTRPIISRRVRRSFPKTILGKTFWGLLMPGSGRAYLFVFANLLACTVTFALFAIFDSYLLPDDASTVVVGMGGGAADVELILLGLLVNLVYPLFFITVVYLLVKLIGLYSPNVTAFLGLVLALFVVFAGGLVGAAMQYLFMPRVFDEYTLFLSFYWYGTAGELYSSQLLGGQAVTGLAIVTISTVFLAFLALIDASKDLTFESLDTPERVLQEQLARRQAKLPHAGESIEEIFDEPT